MFSRADGRITFPAAVLVVLLFSIMLGVQLVNRAEANGFPAPPISEIYIRIGGDVEPATSSIQRDGNVYTFTGSLPNSSIIVQRDNIVIDGANFTLSGYGSHWYQGVVLVNRINVTIKNVGISGFGNGIAIKNSSYITVSGNKIQGTARYIELTSFSTCQNLVDENGNLIDPESSPEILSYGNQIVGNSLSRGNSEGYGIYGFATSNNTITGNNFTSFASCITLYSGGFNIISENQFNASKTGIHLNKDNHNNVYRNNFLSNEQHILASVVDSLNLENAGEGNYWSSYTGEDGDGDGVGDTPYWININFADQHPLMNPVSGSNTVPEFSSWTLVFLVLAMLAVILVVYRRRMEPPT